MTEKEYAIKHAGWLLACVSPANIAKGERHLASLSNEDSKAAKVYRDECLEVYSAGRNFEQRRQKP